MSEERTGEQAFLRLSCLPQPRLLLADTAHRGPRPCPPGQALERWNMGRPHSPARWMEGTPRPAILKEAMASTPERAQCRPLVDGDCHQFSADLCGCCSVWNPSVQLWLRCCQFLKLWEQS